MRKIGKDFYLFYSLNSQIYVGKSSSPFGPFRNVLGSHNGKEVPLIKYNEYFPPKIHTIDADVFVDDDNRAYIYWGSGHGFKDGVCAFAELNDSVSGFKSVPKQITPKSFFEGSYILKRNGKYYLMYSDGIYFNDTYCVHYAVSDKGRHILIVKRLLKRKFGNVWSYIPAFIQQFSYCTCTYVCI